MILARASIALVLFATFLSHPDTREAQSSKLHVPPGFVIEKIAGEPDIVFPMFATFDDRGRLFVAESSGLDLYAEVTALTRKCRIKVLESRDSNGRYKTCRVFAGGLVFPMGLVWRDGKLYVADASAAIALEETGGVGPGGKRTVVLSSFGHRDNGSLHGLVFGPDGLLYMTMGHPDGYKLRQENGTIIQGESGALVRCRPDGSDPEVLCRGFENLVEVVFTPRGEIIGTNNWYQRPSDGLRDALVHLVDGGLYPLHEDVGTPQPITGEPLPPITMFPAVALSGLMRYEGQSFPKDMQENLFSAQHNARKIVRHVLMPVGATFRSQNFDFVSTDAPDFHPSDVLEDADGSMLVVDTGSWYVHHCPTGKIRQVRAAGGIYRVRRANAPAVHDPWGLKLDWNHAAADQLARWLADARPKVRERAQHTLASGGATAIAALANLLDSPADVAAKQRAIWTLAATPDNAALPLLRKVLDKGDPDLVTPAARALGIRRDRQAAGRLCCLLAAQALPVRMAAAEALARCGDASCLPALWKALAAQPDRFLEHALIHAIYWIADVRDLQTALKNLNPRVQKAALLLLDQVPAPRPGREPSASSGHAVPILGYEPVIQRVAAKDADLRRTALRILQHHPEWAEHALGLIRGWLKKPTLSEEERRSLRNLVLAFQAQPPVQELVGHSVVSQNGQTPAQRRILLLETMAQSNIPKVPKPWIDALAKAVHDSAPGVRLQAVRTAAVLQVPELDGTLARLVENKAEPADLRLEALRGLILRRPQLSPAAFDLLRSQLDTKASPVTRLAAAEVLGRSRLAEVQLVQLLPGLANESLISPAVLLPALKRSTSPKSAQAVLDYLTASIRRGWRPPEQDLQSVLDSLPAPVRDKGRSLIRFLHQAGKEQSARLAQFEPLLKGGNAERGRRVFFGKKVACATCHRISNQGGQVGPDLTKIGTIRAGLDILESILVPSSTIAQGYENYVVATADGRAITGIIARQSANILVIKDSSGAAIRLRKDQIEEMKRLSTSLMPDGQERALTRDEFQDLLAFLQSLK